MKKKAIIIGSGISGLSISHLLAKEYDVQVLERSANIGGLIKCDRIDGNLFHRVGGHVFNSKNPEVTQWFWEHFDKEKEFLLAVRNAKILFSGQLIGYPIENFLYQLPPHLVKDIVKELLAISKAGYKTPDAYGDFQSFLIGNFGETLFRLYFGPYNTKIWNTDISKVPLEWLEGKLPMPNIDDVIISNIVKLEIEREALKNETDSKSKARVTDIESQIADLKEKTSEIEVKWTNEKEVVAEIKKLKKELTRAHDVAAKYAMR